jgi:hypothetical protein
VPGCVASENRALTASGSHGVQKWTSTIRLRRNGDGL